MLDPACGDGRFLAVAGERLTGAGAQPVLLGIDIDDRAVAAARRTLRAAGFAEVTVRAADTLAMSFEEASVDVVLGNPPYLSQLAAATTRRGASRHGGGPYADAAAEFLAWSVRAVRPGGRVGLVLPQSVLASRDASPVRAEVDRTCTITWSWWSPRRVFDADVLVCAIAVERRVEPLPLAATRSWSHVVTEAVGIPPLPELVTSGTLGDRARLSANFRDQYYGLVPAVADDHTGPPLVTSGLVDPGRCLWGQRPVTFARRRHARPRVDLARLAPGMRRWADDLLVPKVLVANQTRVVEAVPDPDGAWLPSVPMLTARPAVAGDVAAVWAIAAVLTSPVAAVWAWRRAAGSGLSAGTLRLGPRWLAELPWPAGSLTSAVAALDAGDVAGCGRAVTAAYDLDPAEPTTATLVDWWHRQLPS